MKLLIDMNLSPLWVEFFAGKGIDSVHWSAIGPVNAPDDAIMDYAILRGMVIFTHDLDFSRLLARRKTSQPSLIQVRSQAVLPKDIGEAVVAAIEVSASQLEIGALVTIDPDRHRIRLLPIR